MDFQGFKKALRKCIAKMSPKEELDMSLFNSPLRGSNALP